MKFNSKANTLKNLKLKNAKIPFFLIFKVLEYSNKKSVILKKIEKTFKGKKIIVRSSCYGEDGIISSMAGKFLSIANINSNSSESELSINKVIMSYKGFESKHNQFIVQEYISNTKCSGVITTNDIDSNAPYININYSNSNKTDIVTSGIENTKSILCFDRTFLKKNIIFNKFPKVIQEIENKFKKKVLDIEFLIDNNNSIYIVQVRDLLIKTEYSTREYSESLKKLKKKIKKLQLPHHSLYGDTTFFGVMPDWNPAEIIGTKPLPLSLSLYQELITNSVWSKNRFDLGYNFPRSNRLMTTFLGTPYVDLRVDFNSWIPKKLNKKISKKLVNYYLAKFKKAKSSHDKIEFDIVFTCFNNNTDNLIKDLKKNNFLNSEIVLIKNFLKEINKNTIDQQEQFLSQSKELNKRIDKINKSKMYYIDKIYWLVEDCKNLGTSSFAGLARSAFLAVDIVNSFVETNIITENEKDKFFSSISTISSKIINDSQKFSKKIFLEKHGHLRPNTYEITSLNYKDGYKLYFNKKKSPQIKKNKFTFTKGQKVEIKKFILKSKLNISVENFILFLKNSIKYRELSKYNFSKAINSIFEVMKFVSKRHLIPIEKISYLRIQTVLDLYYNLSRQNVKKIFYQDIENNYEEFLFNKTVPLPDTIYSGDDIYMFNKDENKINYISQKKISGKVYFLKKLLSNNIKGKIVCITSADPGFDFIFTHKIKGLITMYGGANSHMSIRCMELGIPAAIGVGKAKFDKIIKSNFITIDGLAKKIELV